MDRRPLSDSQERARKVLPQYGEGPLVKVAYALNQPEAELIAGLLLEEGIPSVIRRAAGFDVPDFLAAGPRDILVAASGVDVARDALAQLPGEPGADPANVSFAGPSVRGVAMAMLVIAAVSVLFGLVVVLVR
jgi:hypothetical protein